MTAAVVEAIMIVAAGAAAGVAAGVVAAASHQAAHQAYPLVVVVVAAAMPCRGVAQAAAAASP